MRFPLFGFTHEIFGGMLPQNIEGPLSHMLGHTHTQKLRVSEQFQGPLVGREQVLLPSLALVGVTGSHSQAPHPTKL